jgi:hypothetical protein
MVELIDVDEEENHAKSNNSFFLLSFGIDIEKENHGWNVFQRRNSRNFFFQMTFGLIRLSKCIVFVDFSNV